MTRRRDYLSLESDDSDRKPSAGGRTPVRAWLRPAHDPGLPAEYAVAPAGTPPEWWVATIEDGIENNELAGEFATVVESAASAGATAFFVWSVSRRTFEEFTEEAVRTID